jgi:GNAT superfamily N-acetyltransferase
MPESTDAPANSASMLIVRRAAPGDAEELSRLRYAFRLERRPATESPEAFFARCTSWMRRRLSTDSPWAVFVAERDGEILGNIWVQIVEKIPNPGPESEFHAYVSNFFVVPRERNTGAGTRLLNVVLEHCRTFSVDTVFLWPSERSRPLYRRSGFEPPPDMLVLDLPQAGPTPK